MRFTLRHAETGANADVGIRKRGYGDHDRSGLSSYSWYAVRGKTFRNK
jgi:hypothetical protein